MQNRHRQITLAVTALFTLVQLLLLAHYGYTPYPDAEGYLHLARQSVAQGSLYPTLQQINHEPFVWNSGAINLVALSLWLTHSVTPLLVFYALLKGATVWLTAAVAHRLFGRRTALVTLILYVAYPANYGECTSVLSETPFIFLTLLAFYQALHGRSLMAGFLLAVAQWIRPFALVFLLAWAVYAWLRGRRRPILSMLLAYTATLLLIGGSCRLRTGHFVCQAQTGWMALLQYSVDHASAADTSLTLTPDSLNALQRNDLWRRRTLRWIADHPGEYLAQMPRKLIETYVSDNVNFCAFLPDKATSPYLYGPLSLRSLWHDLRHPTAVQALTLFNLVYYAFLLLLFLVAVAQNRRRLLLPAAVVALGTLMLLLVGHGEARFHIPFMPFIIMGAACYRRA
ncbi:glycosyltransferase family 39 protein [Prevotella sp. A2931]|uniref:Glycosyltransferase family 39 protein n=1 Tax=Prevotella illustrans TaxID=2800387 RepID=A0ABS3M6M1_9BACT|nr:MULTISPECIES: glycosyltransferase family 39 protein [Prevotella]MBO1363823.1 glycosyltransferase family 39 protein [Prevotella illustrans]PTL26766.1 hypothetical protein C3V39_06770 [Prevotella sp. oral taxon 820]